MRLGAASALPVPCGAPACEGRTSASRTYAGHSDAGPVRPQDIRQASGPTWTLSR
ncbi:hypothetical protein OH76DRAFT_1406439 [Lentinus brumalis]|uniref:Uncharacterized protein n=1 Tax=Lentinus brumalis TaxID=2498619 RepID=A0A371D2T2_9APHY|nr:hypothetical protein OH76DRAFT_1406439 [Polyporus brumalis]